MEFEYCKLCTERTNRYKRYKRDGYTYIICNGCIDMIANDYEDVDEHNSNVKQEG